MDMTERANDLIYVCERMIDILISENRAMQDRTPNLIEKTLEEKDKLSRFYEKHCRAIALDQSRFKEEVDEDLREQLKDLVLEMDQHMAENAKLLKVNIDSNRRVLLKFAEVAKQLTPHSGVYARDANVGVKAADTAPISLNETL